MAVSKPQMTRRRFEEPDEHRPFSRGATNVVTLHGMTVGLAKFEPGWRWSESVKPIAKTESCQVEHLGYLLSGHLRTRMDDGTEMEAGPGDLIYIPPGHDGWVVGDEPVLFFQIEGGGEYAKGK
jgi:ethanolamine utilization protein EutQ (cupin superfamily)